MQRIFSKTASFQEKLCPGAEKLVAGKPAGIEINKSDFFRFADSE